MKYTCVCRKLVVGIPPGSRTGTFNFTLFEEESSYSDHRAITSSDEPLVCTIIARNIRQPALKLVQSSPVQSTSRGQETGLASERVKLEASDHLLAFIGGLKHTTAQHSAWMVAHLNRRSTALM